MKAQFDKNGNITDKCMVEVNGLRPFQQEHDFTKLPLLNKLHQNRGDSGRIKFAIVVTLYNEEEPELRKTLEGIIDNM
jgi:hypothetical protein